MWQTCTINERQGNGNDTSGDRRVLVTVYHKWYISYYPPFRISYVKFV